jgi:hypothetical protein
MSAVDKKSNCNEPINKTLYAIGMDEKVNYGHGDSGTETHICPKNAYIGDLDFHPLFERREDAEEYIDNLEYGSRLYPVALKLNSYNQ